MTEVIRQRIKIELVRKHISQSGVARTTGLSRQHISDLLTGRRGRLPAAWEKLLAALDLELAVVPKSKGGS